LHSCKRPYYDGLHVVSRIPVAGTLLGACKS